MSELKVSIHTHVETPLSASSLPALIQQAKKLNREYFTYTDHNLMTSAFKAYNLSKKNGLKPILGVEVYFKDRNCQILKHVDAKFFKTTLFAASQEAYQRLTSLVSKNRADKIYLNDESYGLWTWSDLQEAASAGCICVGSDLNDLVAKQIFLNPDNGILIANKLKDIFNNNFYLTISGTVFDKTATSVATLVYRDGSEDQYFANTKAKTNAAKKVSLSEIANNPYRHNRIEELYKNGRIIKTDKPIESVKIRSGFVKISEGDLQLKANRYVLEIAKKTNTKILYTDYAYYAEKTDKIVQDVVLSSIDKRESVDRYMQSTKEAKTYLKEVLKLTEVEAQSMLENNIQWAKQFDGFELKYQVELVQNMTVSDPIEYTLNIIKTSKRMKWDNKLYVDRLNYEMDVLAKNGTVNLLPYFFPIRDVLKHYEEKNALTGPARGSAAGSLIAYLLEITQVDPMEYGLSFERFLSLTRIKSGAYPDIDIDLLDRKLLVGENERSGYLFGTYGNKAGQISTRTMMRLKNTLQDVNRYFTKGLVEPEILKLTKSLPSAPQGVSDKDFLFGFEDSEGNHIKGLIEINSDIQDYIAKRPKEWEIVQKAFGLTRSFGKHASAFIIANQDISNIVPVLENGALQYEAKEIEAAGLIKYDFLVVKQLADIDLAMKLINKKHSNSKIRNHHFMDDGVERYIWDLPEDLEVYESIWNGSTETCFQINTKSMIPFVQKIKPKNIMDISTTLALVRPGPLDFVDPETGLNMAEEYIERRNGAGTIKLPELAKLLPKTYGVMVYQESVSFIATNVGKMKPEDAEELRRVFSKKDLKKALSMKPLFMDGAVDQVGLEKAEMIWAQMETSSRYSFNLSHSVSYSLITYACMYLKHYYPLEWWAAVLTNADEKEISTKLFPYVKEILVAPDINKSSDEMIIDYENKKILSKLGILKGVGDKAIEPIIANRPYKDIKDFVSKKVAGPMLTKRLIHVGVMDSLFPSNYTLIQKMQEYEDAVKMVVYEQKLAEGKNPKPPKQGQVDEVYYTLTAFEDFQMKKKVFPTMPLDLTRLMVKYSKIAQNGSAVIIDPDDRKTISVSTGASLSDIDEMTNNTADIYVTVAAYILKVEEFTYSGGTKKALKVVFDCDGYISEKVLWPNYDTGDLIYPKDIKKESLVWLVLKKRAKKEGKVSSPSSIYKIILEKT